MVAIGHNDIIDTKAKNGWGGFSYQDMLYKILAWDMDLLLRKKTVIISCSFKENKGTLIG